MADIFWYFIFYSFVGFLLEVGFARLIHTPKLDRKCFFFLPLCPVYGLGALGILGVSTLVGGPPWVTALLAIPVATAAEYFMAYVYEVGLGVRFWDYRDLPWNIHGRVCLAFSAIWCLLGVWLTYLIHPLVSGWLSSLPLSLGVATYLLLSLDSGYTVALLRSTGRTDSLVWYK